MRSHLEERDVLDNEDGVLHSKDTTLWIVIRQKQVPSQLTIPSVCSLRETSGWFVEGFNLADGLKNHFHIGLKQAIN